MDLALRTTQYQVEDRSWLASKHGTEATLSITLDLSLFTQATQYPNGYLPSGLILAKVTASGLYGPYTTGAANGLQTATGLLFNAIPVLSGGGTHLGAPMLVHGFIVAAKLPAGTTLDAAAKTAMPLLAWR